MPELLLIFLVSLVGALIVAVPGWLVLRLLRNRSITVYIGVLLGVSVLSMLAGVLGVAAGMFISEHDLHVLLIVEGIAGAVSIGVGVWLELAPVVHGTDAVDQGSLHGNETGADH